MTEPAAADLPEARLRGRYRVAVVCTGNVCRSPTAEVVLTSMLEEAGLADAVTVTSCGLGGWHVDDPMDARSAEALAAAGYDPSRHRARQYDAGWLERHDLLLAMDAGHARDLRRTARSGERGARIRLFRDYDPIDPGADVPDPYYGGPDGFEEVLQMVERTCRRLIPAITVRVRDR